MSPRSEELMSEARSRLRAARKNLDLGEPAVAASAAYYSLLYAARAILSERDLNARTHSGTWNLLWERFVETGELDRELAAAARASQHIRELGDYEAKPPTRKQAAELVDLADRFLAAIDALTGG